MNKKVVKYIILGVGAYAIFATSVIYYYKNNPEKLPWDDREEINREYISSLTLDDKVNTDMIITKLGGPDISEAKQTAEDNLQVLFYRTRHIKSDGITTIDECTPLLFKNNQLIAWGENAYQQYKHTRLSF
ncbi:MAG: DUF3192 domain-containing protein [Gammaproteobacteria bacterium]|nr:DUF3192 domain-containing protein [Gammaproteobacteria bacterium]